MNGSRSIRNALTHVAHTSIGLPTGSNIDSDCRAYVKAWRGTIDEATCRADQSGLEHWQEALGGPLPVLQREYAASRGLTEEPSGRILGVRWNHGSLDEYR